MPILIGASAALPVLGGLAGNLFSSGDVDDAKKLQLQALQGIQNVNAPTADQLKLYLNTYNTPEAVNPTLEQTYSQQASEMNNVSVDPALRQAQMGALARLQQLGQGGLQPEDIANLAAINQQAAGQANAQNAATLQNMQQRGIGGSGAELASKLANAQGAANTQMMAGLNVQGQAAQRALQALAQSGQLGGQMENQQFGEAAQKAQAQDIINRFNAANQQQVAGNNVNIANQGQYYNVGNRNATNNANVDIRNKQSTYNANVPQQVYQNAMQKQAAVYQGQQAMANQKMQDAARTQQMWGQLGQAAGQGAAGFAGYNQNQDWLQAYKGANKRPESDGDGGYEGGTGGASSQFPTLSK